MEERKRKWIARTAEGHWVGQDPDGRYCVFTGVDKLDECYWKWYDRQELERAIGFMHVQAEIEECEDGTS